MKKLSFLIICVIALSGCKRSASDVWEDTKTAGRQVGNSFKTLAGSRCVSKQVKGARDFRGPCDSDFIPLSDEDLQEQLQLDTNHPQPSTSPGEAGSNLPGVDGFSTPSGSLAAVFQNVYFETDDYSISSGASRKTLQKVASFMKQHPNMAVFVEGHCDQRGTAAYNLALGAKRANAVRNFLIDEGVNPEKIFTISYGKERLVAQGGDAESMKLNRRVEFKIYPANV